MSAKTTYTCNLCGKSLDDQGFTDDKPDGFGVMWGTDDSLDVYRPWHNCPIHLCQGCITAVHELHEHVKAKGQLLKR